MNRLNTIAIMISLIFSMQQTQSAILILPQKKMPGCLQAMKLAMQNAIADYRQNQRNEALFNIAGTYVRCNSVKIFRSKKKAIIDSIQLLIKQGAQLDSKHGTLQHTPLMNACKNGHDYVVDELICHGEEQLNRQDAHGNTPLMLAAQAAMRFNVIQILTSINDFNTIWNSEKSAAAQYIPYVQDIANWLIEEQKKRMSAKKED